MRKQTVSNKQLTVPNWHAGALDVVRLATAFISSEAAEHPIEHAFDGQGGTGGSRWVAEDDGEQTVTLAFDTPQTISQVEIEVEENEVNRTQELQLAVSVDKGQTYRELVRQEFNFSPPQTIFEREQWRVDVQGVTHLRLSIKPDKSGRSCRASLTSLVLRTGYVIHTLTASLWCLQTTSNYSDCVLKAVNLGGDTDTTGCVAGGLAGVLYGLKAIPQQWIRALARHDDVATLFNRFADITASTT
jgi:hypothetical protein